MINSEELEKKGYERRGVYEEPRLSEIVEMYREAGYEVVLVEYDKNSKDGCSVCLDDYAFKGGYKVVYTKKVT